MLASHPIFADILTRLIPIIAYRLVNLTVGIDTEPTYTSIIPAIVTEAALQFSVFAVNITCLKPLLQAFHSSPATYSKTSSYSRSGVRSFSSRDQYANLDAMELAPGQITAYESRDHSENKTYPVNSSANPGTSDDAVSALTDNSEAAILQRDTEPSSRPGHSIALAI